MAKSSSQSEAIDKLIQKLNLIKTTFFNNIKNANNRLEEELKINVTTENFSDIVTKSKEILDKFVGFSRSVISGKTKIANAITEKGIQTDSSGSFENMSENIKKIKTGYSVGENLSSDKVKYEVDYKYRLYKTFDINSKALCVYMKDDDRVFFGCQDGSVNVAEIFNSNYRKLYNHSDYVRDIWVKDNYIYSAGDDKKVLHYNWYFKEKKWECNNLTGYVMVIKVGLSFVWAGTNQGYLYAIDKQNGTNSGSIDFSEGILDIVVKEGNDGFFITGEKYSNKTVRTMTISGGTVQWGARIGDYLGGDKIASPWNVYKYDDSGRIWCENHLGREDKFLSTDFSYKDVYCSDEDGGEYIYATKNNNKFIVALSPDLKLEKVKFIELMESGDFSLTAMSIYKNFLCLSVQENTQQKIKIYKLEKTDSFEIIK